MRAVGKWSLSSLLSAVLTMASVVVAIALGIAMLVLVTSPWIDLGGNGRLGIPVALRIDEQALHVGAPSLGPGTPRLTKVTGTLEFEAPSRRAIVAPVVDAPEQSFSPAPIRERAQPIPSRTTPAMPAAGAAQSMVSIRG